MKIALSLLLVLAPAFAQLVPRPEAAKPAAGAMPSIDQPKLSVDVIRNLEKDFNDRLEMACQNKMRMVGGVRGLYIPGYGLVLTAEVDLALTPISGGLLRREISETEKADFHKKKLEQLPLIEQTMRDMTTTAAQKLDLIPLNERVVVAFKFWYQNWEDQTRLPHQIMMSADRKSAAAGMLKEDFTK